MAGKLRLTVACGDYEIVRALKEFAHPGQKEKALGEDVIRSVTPASSATVRSSMATAVRVNPSSVSVTPW